MRNTCLLLATISALAISSVSSARIGSEGGGGGSGCMADFMRSAFEVSQWLEKHGSKLEPTVSSNAFLASINPEKIRITEEDLRYQGNPVDAFYDGDLIMIRCDRLEKRAETTRHRVVAHEIFRKMGLEGDHYEITRQISLLNPTPQPTQRSFCRAYFDVDSQIGGYARVTCDGLQKQFVRLDLDFFSGQDEYIRSFDVAVDRVVSSYTKRGYKVVNVLTRGTHISREYILQK